MKLGNLIIFTFALLILFGIIILIFPKDGIPIGFNQKLYLPSIEEIYIPSTASVKKKEIEVATILEEEVAPDTIVVDPKVQARLDSIKAVRMQDSLRKWQLSLHYPGNDKSLLYSFF